MKNFHDYYFGLNNAQREAFVAHAGTTIGYAERVAGGFARPSYLKMRRFVKASKGKTSIDAIVQTYEARNGATI